MDLHMQPTIARSTKMTIAESEQTALPPLMDERKREMV
jgi:hypothetical protein